MCPTLVVPYNTRLNVTSRSVRPGLVTVTLAVFGGPRALGAEFFGHAAEAELAAADIKGAFGACCFGVPTTLCMSVAIAPTQLIRRLATSSAGFWSVVALPRLFWNNRHLAPYQTMILVKELRPTVGARF